MSGANASGFGHVETWVFDLDNTLYPADCDLFAQIDRRMGAFIAAQFGLSLSEAHALRHRYYVEHGTTLAGLMQLHDVCPQAFLDYVHDIDLDVVRPAPELATALDRLPGRKFVFTNGSRKHAEAVVGRLGLLDRFEDIFDIHALEYIYPKPTREAYDRFVKAHGITSRRTAMFDDLPHNLETAHALGMTTVWIDCRAMDRPEHRMNANWTTLPAHIHHRTEALLPFLADIGVALAEDTDRGATLSSQPQAC